jgi:hypothetical protein
MIGRPDPHLVLAEHRRRVAAGVARAQLHNGIRLRSATRSPGGRGRATVASAFERMIRRPRRAACCTTVSPCCA